MQNVLMDADAGHRGTLVIEFAISVLRALEMKAADSPSFTLPDLPEESVPDAAPIQVRVIVAPLRSTISVFYRNVDAVGAPGWQEWFDVVKFTRILGHYFERRSIVAEAFRRLASEGSRQVTEAPTGARVVDIGLA